MQLRDNMAFLCRELERYGISAHSDSAILPILVGEEKRAMAAMEELKQRGYYVSAIRYPTVARGSARLRVALMSSHTREELAGLAQALACVLGQ